MPLLNALSRRRENGMNGNGAQSKPKTVYDASGFSSTTFKHRFANGVVRPYLDQYDDYCGPHCDPRILHSPGECDSCDKFPVYQKAREIWGVAFTRTDPYDPVDPTLYPDPAEAHRGTSAFSWQGNRASGSTGSYMEVLAQELVNAVDPSEIERIVDRLTEIKKELEDDVRVDR